MLFSETVKFAMNTHERKREACPRLMILRRRGRRLERRADCEGIKFVTGELRREWHTEERFLCAQEKEQLPNETHRLSWISPVLFIFKQY